MSRFSRSFQLIAELVAAVLVSSVALKAEDRARFAVFSNAQLDSCSRSWPSEKRDKLKKIFRSSSVCIDGDVLTYLIVPKPMIDSSEPKASEETIWGIFEPERASANPDSLSAIGYVKPLNPMGIEGIMDNLRESYAKAELQDVYGEDVSILDDLALRNLFRLCRFNKSSPFDSSDLRALKSFADEFLISERKWFFNPEGNGPMIVISDLRQKKATLVRVVMPVQNGSVLSFPVFRTDRAVLRDALRVLQGEEIPITITLPIENLNALPDGIVGLAHLLDVRLIGSKGSLLRGFNEITTSNSNIYLSGRFSREALYAAEVQIELPQGSPYKFVSKDKDQGGGHIESSQTFKITAQKPEFDAPPLSFNLTVVHIPTVARLRTDDIWHHEVSFGEAQISRDLKEVKERQDFFSADLKSSANTDLLFADPLEYVRKLGSRIGREVLGLEAREQRIFALEMDQTDRALDALWAYLQIARFLSKENVKVVVVKNVPSSMKRWRWVATADRMSSWVTSYLDYKKQKLPSEEQSRISYQEVEAPAQEDHITRSVGILLVPQQEKQQEKLP